jgi:hypothetical protein
MVVEEHEKPLMQLVVLYKLGPAAPEVHLTTAIIVHLHFIQSSSSRFFVEASLSKLAPVHELSKFQRNALLLDAWLMTSLLGTPRGRCDEYSSKVFPQLRNQGMSIRRGETND